MSSDDAKANARRKWKALESNPEVLTSLGRKLGLKEVRIFHCCVGCG